MNNLEDVKIKVIYDDLNESKSGYLIAFGFAALIEFDEKIVLFDAGTKDDVLKNNLSASGVLPSEIDAVILSHNHYDHANGLPAVLNGNANIPVYVHKYWKNHVRHKGNPVPPNNIKIVQNGRKLTEIGAQVYVTNCYQSKDYGGIYEQACYVETKNAFILLCGCSHPGLDVFLDDRKNLGIDSDKALHIMGGFHGFEFENERVKQIRPYIRSIVIFHCTKKIMTFQSQFQEKCSIGTVGKTYHF